MNQKPRGCKLGQSRREGGGPYPHPNFSRYHNLGSTNDTSLAPGVTVSHGQKMTVSKLVRHNRRPNGCGYFRIEHTSSAWCGNNRSHGQKVTVSKLAHHNRRPTVGGGYFRIEQPSRFLSHLATSHIQRYSRFGPPCQRQGSER